MKQLMMAVCCAIAASFVVVSAQSGTMDHDKTMKKGKNVTMTGCLAEGTGGQYMLTDATKGHMKSDTKTSTTGDMKGDMKGMTYDLMGGENLKAHVGHKVEVTGMMDSKKMMKNSKMDKDEMGTSDSAHGAITVKSVKMISTTCP